MSAKKGRNDPCPCGSGKKYKNCCETGGGGLGRGKLNRAFIPVLLLVGLAAVATAYVSVSGENVTNQEEPKPELSTPAPNAYPPAPNLSLTPQPPGPVPAGKVWAAEHGHWHDATGQPVAASSGQLTPVTDPGSLPHATSGDLIPQPPGPAPEGKIWSPKCGHWHNATEAQAEQGQLVPQPPGTPPPGKTWSAEHGHWHGPPTSEELMKDEKFMELTQQRDKARKENLKAQNQRGYKPQLPNQTVTLPSATDQTKKTDAATKTPESTTDANEEKKP